MSCTLPNLPYWGFTVEAPDFSRGRRSLTPPSFQCQTLNFNFLEVPAMKVVLCMLARFPFFRGEKCPYGAKPHFKCVYEDKDIDCKYKDVWYI
jgi:hypothetical protein